MSKFLRRRGVIVAMVGATAMTLVAACTSMMPTGGTSQTVMLTGAGEVPPVTTTASGTGTVMINPDRTVSVSLSVTGFTATAAHIHEGAPGANGPVIVPFTKTGDNTFVSPDGAKLTESQYASYKAGNLYINAHSAAHPGGEIRAQLKGL